MFSGGYQTGLQKRILFSTDLTNHQAEPRQDAQSRSAVLTSCEGGLSAAAAFPNLDPVPYTPPPIQTSLDTLRRNLLGLSRLPWDVALFGRAWITKLSIIYVESDGSITFVFEPGERKTLPLPEMKYGQPVDSNLQITPGRLGALLLFQYGGGECCMVPPYHSGTIRHLGPPLLIDPQEIAGRP